MKEERAEGRENGVGEGTCKILDLRYKNNDHIGIKLKKCNNNHHINKQ